MNELLKALQEGKTLIWKSNLPRYYKLVDDVVMYSDDLKQWLMSNLTPKQAAQIVGLEVLERNLPTENAKKYTELQQFWNAVKQKENCVMEYTKILHLDERKIHMVYLKDGSHINVDSKTFEEIKHHLIDVSNEN